jgi:hypothetical protein
MADLLHAVSYTPRAMTMAGPVESFHEVAVNLYCWPHKTVHRFDLADVEQIVYALGAAERDGHRAGADDPSFGRQVARLQAACLREVLKTWAGDPDLFAEHVEQGVECRVAHRDG